MKNTGVPALAATLTGLLLLLSPAPLSPEGKVNAAWKIDFPDGVTQMQTCQAEGSSSRITTRDFFADGSPADIGATDLIVGKDCRTLLEAERARVPQGRFSELRP